MENKTIETLKQNILAVLLGLVLGLSIAGGLYLNSKVKQNTLAIQQIVTFLNQATKGQTQ